MKPRTFPRDGRPDDARKRRRAWLLCGALMLALVSACSKGGDDAPPSQTPTDADLRWDVGSWGQANWSS